MTPLKPQDYLETAVEEHGIDMLSDFMAAWGDQIMQPWPEVLSTAPALTVFDAASAKLPMQYRRATFAPQLLTPVSAYQGARHKAILVFEAGSDTSGISLPSSAKGWSRIGVEITAADYGKVFSHDQYERFVAYWEAYTQERDVETAEKREEERERATAKRDEAFGSW